MKTFHVHTLGCKVNHYESEQVAALLRSFGLVESDASHADLRVVNTCSVTGEAAAKSRQASRRMVRLPVLAGDAVSNVTERETSDRPSFADTREPFHGPAVPSVGGMGNLSPSRRPRVIVTGCWVTGERVSVAELPGVDAVITHHDDVAAELERLLELWRGDEPLEGRRLDRGPVNNSRDGDTSRPQRLERHAPADSPTVPIGPLVEPPPERMRKDGWITEAGLPAGSRTAESKADPPEKVNLQIYAVSVDGGPENPKKISAAVGTTRLPLLGERQTGRQRAFLKIQDGCDAHCTYCIIPRLRPTPWSKPVDDVVEEATRLVAAGHFEIVLTGVFLSAYGHDTALRRRRPGGAIREPLADLVSALCTRVPGMRRLRLSSLEPGDLTHSLVAVLRSHAQVVPHFHLPLQSGCDHMLRRMNRQYTRDGFVRMIDRVRGAFDRPALTTDVIVGFPGETTESFGKTLDVVDRAAFIHVHAFPYSPRPGTAAARWTRHFVAGAVINERMDMLGRRAAEHSYSFRKQFVGNTVVLLVERDAPNRTVRHGRCERHYEVEFHGDGVAPGDSARVRVDEVTREVTRGTLVSVERPVGGAV